jgi:hypothetical protein
MHVLGVLLPISIAVALSSVPIMAMVVLLLAPRGQAPAIAYLIGYATGLAVVTVSFTAGLRVIPRGDAPLPQVWVGVGEIGLGVVAIVLSVWSFRRERGRRRDEGAVPALPGWLQRLGRAGRGTALLVGLALNVRPKALVLATAAALAMNADELTPLTWAIDTAIYLAVGLSTAAAPVIIVWRSGERARPVLERGREWLARNSYVVTSVVVLMVGAVLIGDGLSRL